MRSTKRVDETLGVRLARWGVMLLACAALFIAADRWPWIGFLLESAEVIGIVLIGFVVVVLGALGSLRI